MSDRELSSHQSTARLLGASAMHLVYIDDSQEHPVNTFSAIAISHDKWREVFKSVRDWRHNLKETDGIYVTKELHAWKFVSGRGRISSRIVTKRRRCQIFVETLKLLSEQKGVHVFNTCNNNQAWAFERLLNRINRTMLAWQSYAMLICDEGKESEYTRLVRKMGVFNPIPSRYGVWQDTGRATRNIPIDRIIEDPFFKNSERSYFIQLADFCAYALLRKEKHLASKNA